MLVIPYIKMQDFFASLVGFAGTLANIQDRGETMMDGIRSQREELLMLERKAEEADIKREEADNIAEKVEEDNKKMKTEVEKLRMTRNDLEIEMEIRRSVLFFTLYQKLCIICSDSPPSCLPLLVKYLTEKMNLTRLRLSYLGRRRNFYLRRQKLLTLIN